jgi:Carotenoid biosynthesis protein
MNGCGIRLSHVAFEMTTYVLAVVLVIHAKKKLRWLSTLFWATAFGLVVETLIVKTANTSSTHYTYGEFLVMFGKIPLCVAVGWGTLIYVSTWTAQRLALPWALRPLAAALLAVNVDLSLDPIAQQECLWNWASVTPPDYYGVPFDNFLGWFAIVALYAGFVRGLFRLAPRGGGGLEPTSVPVAILVPAAAALFALGGMFLLRLIINSIYQAVGQIFTFSVVFGGALVVAWGYARKSRRNHPVSLPVLLVPLAIHVLALLTFIAARGERTNPTLLVFLPVNLILGFFMYAWISLDTLVPEGTKPDTTVTGVNTSKTA